MLLSAEGVDLHFTEAAVHEVARVAEELNLSLQNIGARRLHTVMERIVEPISFSAPELVAQVGTFLIGSVICVRSSTRGDAYGCGFRYS